MAELRQHKPELIAFCHRRAMAEGAAAEVSRIGLAITADDIFACMASCDFEDPELMTPEAMTALAHVVQDNRMRERGLVPPGWTAITKCRHCGPVWVWPGSPPAVLGCPWCFSRVAGRPIPRAESGETRLP